MVDKLTEMQQFALGIINRFPATGADAGFVADLWYRSKGRTLPPSSRRCFGATSAGYRACRALVAKKLAICKNDHSGTMFYPVKTTNNDN
jgi:hypothetical protein